jgi:hypothetical protein
MSVALVNQHAMRIRLIVFLSLARPALPYFSTLSHKRLDFREKVTEHKMCILIFFTKFEISPILRRIQLDCILNVSK